MDGGRGCERGRNMRERSMSQGPLGICMRYTLSKFKIERDVTGNRQGGEGSDSTHSLVMSFAERSGVCEASPSRIEGILCIRGPAVNQERL